MTYDRTEFKRLYDMGLSDIDIADLCGCHIWTVGNWRRRSHILPNASRGLKNVYYREFNKAIDNMDVEDLSLPESDPESLFEDKAFLEKLFNKELD
jgi:hypothetical protein